MDSDQVSTQALASLEPKLLLDKLVCFINSILHAFFCCYIYLNSPLFWACASSLLKTPWEKEKMLVKVDFVVDMVVKNVGKGKNNRYQHFPLFAQCFKRLLLQGCCQAPVAQSVA